MNVRLLPSIPPSNSTSVAFEASRLVKASTGILIGFSGYSSKASPQFIQVHDNRTVPANGAIPVIVLTVNAGSSFSYNSGILGRNFTKGIIIVNSSTAATLTIGVADIFVDVQYS